MSEREENMKDLEDARRFISENLPELAREAARILRNMK